MKKYILLLLMLILPARVLAQAELSSTNYKAKYGLICLAGPGATSPTNADDLKNIIGANIGPMSGLAYSIVSGLNLLYEPPAAEEEDLLIEGLGALTSPGGSVIEESNWQSDNDPYFYWRASSLDIEILGYSYAIDELPDDEVDSTNTSYYFPEDSIVDTTHTFYVKAQRASGLWGDAVSFEIWVDATSSTINNLTPALGSVVSDDQVEVGAALLDTTSGIDPDSIEMRINQAVVEPVYSPESGRLSFVPAIPFSEGEIIVSLKVGDIAGNYAIPLAWSFVIDTEGPTGTLLINNDDEITNTNVVTLNISAEDDTSGVTQMVLSNDGVFDTETWEPYADLRKNWILPAIDGVRKVYARVKDEAGNISESFFDDINLVLIAPDTFILSGPAGITQSQEAHFDFRGSLDDCQFSYKFDNGVWSDWSADTSATASGLLEGNHYFTVRAAKDLNKDDLLQIDEVDPTPALRVWTISFTGLLKPPAQPEKPIKVWEEE